MVKESVFLTGSQKKFGNEQPNVNILLFFLNNQADIKLASSLLNYFYAIKYQH